MFSKMADVTRVPEQPSYIYCILLPFRCSTITAEATMLLSTGRQLLNSASLPPSESVVAKVGITANPAERLCDIFNTFEQFGEPQPLLRHLSRSDDPQTTIAKAKSMDEVIFIEKVHTPGNAEHDIRDALQAGQPKLPQKFFTSFADCLPKEKMGYLDVVGMTEWIMMKQELAIRFLQQKFRKSGIFELGLLTLKVPAGDHLFREVNHFCSQYFKIHKFPSPAMSGLHPLMIPTIFIEFKATNFAYIM